MENVARTIVGHLCSQVDELNVVDEFPNALMAMKFLNKNENDLIFLDIHMPDFTGFDFIETLKIYLKYYWLPLIVTLRLMLLSTTAL